MTIRVLHLLGTAAPEGAATARMVRQLALALDETRFQLEALFLGEDGPLLKEMEDAGVMSRVLPWRDGRNAIRLAGLWRELRSSTADIVHLHLWSRGVRYAAAAAGKPLLLHLHARVIEPSGEVVRQIPTGGADLVIAVSQAVAASAARARVIYPGVTLAPPCVRPDAPLTIGTASRLVALKNIQALLEVMSRLRKRFQGLRLEIAGEGPERAGLEQHARGLGVSDCVQFLGWVPELLRATQRWSLFALASKDEGLPMAALEMMAAGLPVVAPAVGGIPELIEDGVSGCLYAPRDPAALERAVGEMLREPATRLRIGAAARERVATRFSAQRMASDFAEVYQQLAARPARRE